MKPCPILLLPPFLLLLSLPLAADVNLQGEEWNATSSIDVSGGLAYVVGAGGLHIVDVSNPVSPTLVSNLSGRYLYYVSAADGRAYVTGDSSCLTIIDASDPLHPAELGVHCEPYLPERVTIVGSTAYVAFGSGGLHGINVADPLSPTLDFSYDTPGYAISSAVVSNTIYVADAEGGLLILGTGVGQSEARDLTWSTPAAVVTAPDNSLPSEPPAFGFGGRGSLIHLTRDWAGPQPTPSPHHQLDTQSTTNSRRIAGTCVVTSTADSGLGTLRRCMDNAMSGDTITFDPVVFSPQNPVTIALQTGLPFIW